MNIHGTEYRKTAVVFLGYQSELPEFGSIYKIVVLACGYVVFLVKKYVTIQYHNHFHAFEVRRELIPETIFLDQEQFGTYLPAHTVKPYGSLRYKGSFFVAPRYTVPEN